MLKNLVFHEKFLFLCKKFYFFWMEHAREAQKPLELSVCDKFRNLKVIPAVGSGLTAEMNDPCRASPSSFVYQKMLCDAGKNKFPDALKKGFLFNPS